MIKPPQTQGEVCSSRGFAFDPEEAERPVFFVQEFCRHVKGPLAGERLRLQPWQQRLTRDLFGWKQADGLRRYRHVWLEVPRKTGKSTFAAAIGLYMLMVDPEPGAEIVIAAANAEHASVCYNIARAMIERDPDLSAVCKVSRRGLVYKDARIIVVSPRQETILGHNVSCLLFDDVFLQQARQFHDALMTSMAARTQPLAIYATSAGWARSSFAWEMHEYARKVRDGLIDDPAWLVTMFGAEADDDWTDPAVWRKAHPGIGVSVSETFIQQQCQRAQETPGFVGSFRQHYLNIWGQERARWLDISRWDQCGVTDVDPKRLQGRECRAGLDLSSTTDLSALVLVFRDEDDGYTLLPFAFCPGETIVERQRRDRVDYVAWRDQGFLIATEGNTVDHGAIRRKLLELSQTYRITELAYDRWNSSMLINQLIDDGISCVPVAQTNSALNAPARELERVLAAGTLRHGRHPVLRWCAGNVVPHVDISGDLRPSKRHSVERIDLVTALLMGISRHLVADWTLPRAASLREAKG